MDGMDWSGIDRLQAMGAKVAQLRDIERQRQIDQQAARMTMTPGTDANQVRSFLMDQMPQAPQPGKGLFGFLGNVARNMTTPPIERGISPLQQGMLGQAAAGELGANPTAQPTGLLGPAAAADLRLKRAHAGYYEQGGGRSGRNLTPAQQRSALLRERAQIMNMQMMDEGNEDLWQEELKRNMGELNALGGRETSATETEPASAAANEAPTPTATPEQLRGMYAPPVPADTIHPPSGAGYGTGAQAARRIQSQVFSPQPAAPVQRPQTAGADPNDINVQTIAAPGAMQPQAPQTGYLRTATNPRTGETIGTRDGVRWERIPQR